MSQIDKNGARALGPIGGRDTSGETLKLLGYSGLFLLIVLAVLGALR